jgi:CO dehydrogenase maturation factor
MARIIVCTGRGGAGKSTFVALMSRYLSSPALLVDLDPDLSLADMLGIDLAKEGKKTLVEALYQAVKERQRGGSPLTPVEERFAGLLWTESLYEGRGFDVLTLGVKDLEGCYCFPDHLLRKTISKLAKNYKNLVVDSPAGLEHLNRNLVSEVDDLFIILDPSEKSLTHIKKVKIILREVGMIYRHFYLVGNYMFDEGAEQHFAAAGEVFLGRIDYDPQVEEYNLQGKSLRELAADSPACQSVKKILEKAGVI